MCKTPIAYLLHILEECNYILSFNGNICWNERSVDS